MTTGTEGNDTLTNDPNVNPETIHALGGDDTISFVFGMTDTHLEIDLYGGDGYDTITMSASEGSAANVGELYFGNRRAFVAMSIDYFGIEKIVLELNSAGNLFTGDTEDRFHIATGAATISTGGGEDRIYVDSDYDGVTVHAGSGDDVVVAGNAEFMDNYPENYRDFLYGDEGNDYLSGGGGDDRLDGGTGRDRMLGRNGDDSYFVDDAGDSVVEFADAGLDTVYSSVTFDLSYQHIERLFLTGTGAIDAYGNSLANTLVGNGNHNILDGRGGIDVMNGGGGNDTYIVDNVADSVIETRGGGSDTVRSSVTFFLSDSYEIETLVLTGSEAINGYGNRLDNRIYGNSGNNLLNGGLGADQMHGGDGDDIFYVNQAGDKAWESSATGGNDTVYSALGYDLAGQYVENLILTDGSAGWTASGNSLDNRIYGNSGQDTIDGRAGADLMVGRDGDDTYYVDNAGDRVVEAAGGGNDIVYASGSFNLAGTHVETLVISGRNGLTGTGNSLANRLVSTGEATLRGLGGDDVLEGYGRLYGGTGNDDITTLGHYDRIYFDTALNASTNVDRIHNFQPASQQTLYLSQDIFAELQIGSLAGTGALHFGRTADDSADRILYDSSTGEIFYDRDGSGAAEAVLFARMDPGTILSTDDFWVY